MKQFYIAIAGYTIEIHALYDELENFCKRYEVAPTQAQAPDFTIEMTQADIDREYAIQQKIQQREYCLEHPEDGIQNQTKYSSESDTLELLACYRKIVDTLNAADIFLMHGSAIAVDGQAYLFTAKSGTGKSTHASLWRQTFGDRAVTVNDDKPLISLVKSTDGSWLTQISGTPWDGKHHLSSNLTLPLKAICILKRGEDNAIREISYEEAYPILLQQTHRSADKGILAHTLELLECMRDRVHFYELHCNMELEAARVAYTGMNQEEA